MDADTIPANADLTDVYNRIEAALDTFLAAKLAHGALEGTEPKAPSIPDAITAEEDYEHYRQKLEDYAANYKQWQADRQAASDALRQAKDGLIKALPWRNCWFKIGKIAVGYYHGSDGDYHVRVHPWTLDGMPKIHDR